MTFLDRRSVRWRGLCVSGRVRHPRRLALSDGSHLAAFQSVGEEDPTQDRQNQLQYEHNHTLGMFRERRRSIIWAQSAIALAYDQNVPYEKRSTRKLRERKCAGDRPDISKKNLAFERAQDKSHSCGRLEKGHCDFVMACENFNRKGLRIVDALNCLLAIVRAKGTLSKVRFIVKYLSPQFVNLDFLRFRPLRFYRNYQTYSNNTF